MSTTATAPQASYVEEAAYLVFNFTLQPNQHYGRVPVNIDRDADFMATGIHGSSNGNFTLNFRLPSGRLFASAECNNGNFLGTANQPAVIGPPPIYRAGSTGPELDMTDTSGAINMVQLIFSGIRRLRTS